MEKRRCQVEGCQGKYLAKGFCATHYQKSRQAAIAAMQRPSTNETLKTSSPREQIASSATGIARQLDNLGRIVLPIELRRSLNIETSDSLEIFVDQDMIILKKYAPGCVFCGSIQPDMVYFKGKMICRQCTNGH